MSPQIVDLDPSTTHVERNEIYPQYGGQGMGIQDDEKIEPAPPVRQDAFGDEEFAEVKYKVLKWWYVSMT